VLRDVAAEFGMPMTSGRGFSSLPPRIKMRNRYRASGKQQFILIIVSDFDPAGEWIAQSFARSMRDDFDVKVHPIKAALTLEQVQGMDLPSSIDVKDSTHKKEFVRRYGRDQQPFELEALHPTQLQQIVNETIESVLNLALYNGEIRQAHEDARQITGIRQTVQDLLKDVKVS
jgi:hypothetical protein